VEAIIFASPSAFQTFSNCMGEKAAANLSTRVQFAAIGPITANAIRSAGERVEIEAGEPSAIGLANAIASHYQREAARVRPA
jgi:uroporphyrinogen-III synthase